MEVWKPVVGYEGYYEVSDLGRVRSIDRVVTDGSRRRGRIRKVTPNGDCGHLYVMLSRGNQVKCVAVHTLVLQTFVGPCPEGQEARHLDGDARSNLKSNLKWGTPAENTEDKHRHGTVRRGERHWNARLTSDQVQEIRTAASKGEAQHKIGARFGVRQQHVSRIVTERRWAA